MDTWILSPSQMENTTMEVKKYQPKSLETLAYKTFFWDLMSNLLLSTGFAYRSEHEFQAKLVNRIKQYRDTASCNRSESSGLYVPDVGDVVASARRKMSRSLIGVIDHRLRMKMLRDFRSKVRYNIGDPLVLPVLTRSFLNCVVGESILELDIVASRYDNETVEMIESIAARSPHLCTLSITFTNSYECGSAVRSLRLLKQLRTLTLTGIGLRSVVRHAALSCPQLETLRVADPWFENNYIYAILGGENGRAIEYEAQRKGCKQHEYQIPEELLTPVSQSISDLSWLNGLVVLNPFEMAFILRHLPNLKHISVHEKIVTKAMELLYSILKQPEIKKRPRREQQTGAILWYAPSFSGHFYTTKLYGMYVDEEHQLEAVKHLCPQLESITFRQKNPDFVAEKLGQLLTFSKLEEIDLMYEVSANNRQIILRALGSQIRTLSFYEVQDIDLMDLMACSKLEDLTISARCSLLNNGDGQRQLTTAEEVGFLPKLRRLECGICLGSMSRLLQEKRSYTHLRINCCHVATKESEWARIMQFWPKLQYLNVYVGVGLSPALARQIFQRFNQLRILVVGPKYFGEWNDSEDSACLEEDVSVTPYGSCSLFPWLEWPPNDYSDIEEYI